MKFAKQKNKKTKSYIRFDVEDRRDYLLGFRKRKQERQERAKQELLQLKKKEKREIKKKRIEMVQDMIGAGVSDSDSEDGQSSNLYSSSSSPSKPTECVTETCGGSTVQISGLSLESKMHLGINSSASGAAAQTEKSEKKLKSTSKLKFPLCRMRRKSLKTAIWKCANKDAVKNFKAEKRKKKLKKKVMITEL